jgi:hypothetical protein
MQEIGIIKVDKIVEHKDGSATIYFSGVTKKIKEIVKKIYKRKRWSDKLFNKFVVDGIENYYKRKRRRK